MDEQDEDFSDKAPAWRRPLLIGVAVIAAAAVAIVAWAALRPKDSPAPAPTPSASLAPSPAPSASPEPSAEPSAAASAEPSPAPAGEWTAERLEAVIKSNTPIRFVKDSIRLLPGEKDKVEAIAGALAHYRNVQLLFRGHAADFNLKRFQYELSLERASAIRWMLEYRAGDGISAVTVRGLGSSEPVSRGDSEAARAPNRRVEIILQNAEAAP